MAKKNCSTLGDELLMNLLKNQVAKDVKYLGIPTTLSETNISPENRPGNGDSYWKPSCFRGNVSFRECNIAC